ncbi:MAG: DUF4139 domain-containing protein [Treponema sp.]|nr:DUF4139 domain-containing protein [Treponema sp.]
MAVFLFVLVLLTLTGTGGFTPRVFAQAAADSRPAASQAAAPVPGQGQAGPGLPGQSLPLKRIALFSSGVAYFEHAGVIRDSAVLTFPFRLEAMNDALKSLSVRDSGAAASPSVRYPSGETLWKTLRSLAVDLSGNPDMAAILLRLRGEEIEAAGPVPLRGRILGVEYRPGGGEEAQPEAWLSLLGTEGGGEGGQAGVRLISLKELGSFRFTNPGINADLVRALNLIMASRNADSRELEIHFPGAGSRNAAVSYVIPAPVWKTSYRLDLSGPEGKALLQAWAIVDNDGDTDWRDVELSLVAGRPVSFVQNLYPPYYLDRPALPLSIAGIARAETWDTGYGPVEAAAAELRKVPAPAPAPRAAFAEMDAVNELAEAPAASMAGAAKAGGQAAASGAETGSAFEFTMAKPVSLDRQRSAMLPLAESPVKARKILILAGDRALGRSVHPALGLELTNDSGIRLPAGPVTVYDGGSYAGDALIEFLPEGEKRLISYGEDLSVIGTAAASGNRLVGAVTAEGGVMTISRRQIHERKYTVKNASSATRDLIIEHPVTRGASLAEPAEPLEQTAGAYRFAGTVKAGEEFVLTVREETLLSERVGLLQTRPETLLAYSTNQEIPPHVRAVLRRAVELKKAADTDQTAAGETGRRREDRIGEQERIRANLEAAGNGTAQGQEYLRRLAALDTEIDRLAEEFEAAREKAKASQKVYEDYLSSIRF